MKKSNQNFVIDTLAFIGFILLTTTGILMRYILPSGSGKYSTIWNLDRHEWGAIHFWLSVVFFFILALHLVFHWRWILRVITNKPRKASGNRVLLGFIGLLAITFLAITPLLTPVEVNLNSKESSTYSSHEQEVVSIKGSMTLKELEETTKVPAEYIIKSLGLPTSVLLNEKLSTLKDSYRFEMNEVRQLVAEYKKEK